MRRAMAATVLALAWATTPPATAQRVALEDDEAVRRLWQQLTLPQAGLPGADGVPAAAQAGQATGPAIVPVAGDGLSVVVAVEQRHVRSDAPSLLTPLRRGAATTASVAWDGGRLSADGVEVWTTGQFIASSDRALLRQARWLLGSFQVGRRDAASYLAAGDVQPALSRLGTALGLRGVLAQRAGASGVLTAAAGTVVDTWSVLGDEGDRRRDVVALKYEHWLTPGLTVFATLQRQADQAGQTGQASPVLEPPAPAPALPGLLRATTFSAGATLQHSSETLRGSLHAEWASSRAQRSAADATPQSTLRRHAALVESEIAWSDVGLRAGWQRIDAGFVSPSLQVQAGQREHYLVAELRPDPAVLLRAEWRAARWLVGDLDAGDEARSVVRRSDAISLAAQASLQRWLPGWALEASLRHARSEQPAGRLFGPSEGRQRWVRAAVSHAAGSCSAQLALGRQTLQDSLAAAAGGTLDLATAQLGCALRGWALPALGMAGAQGGWAGLLLSRQRQGWAGLGGNTAHQWQLLLSQDAGPRWSTSASLGQSLLGGWGGGPTVRLSTASLQGRWALRDTLALAAFWRIDANSGIVGWSPAPVRQLGLQLASRF